MLMLKRNVRQKTRDVIVRSMRAKSHTQYHMTAASGDPLAGFSAMAEQMAEVGIQTLQEKVYGLARAKDDILSARSAAYRARGLDATLPVTYIDGAPVRTAAYAGAQIWGFGPGDDGSGVTTLSLPGCAHARSWKGRDCRLLYLPYLRGVDSEGRLASCAAGQAKTMFANALSGLRAQGMSYTQVIRTWIYIARLLDWYGDFNRVRTEFHDQQGMVRGRRDSVFPASTGIQGRGDAGVECCMDLLAVDTYGNAEVDPIVGSARQPPAFTYGAGFSRGMVLTLEGTKIVFVSGTASTNAAGEVAHLKQPEAQCMETLMSIAAILKEQGGGLQDICMSTLFCKTPEVYQAYQSVHELLGLRPFPTVPVLADVCRPEWLVEIEAVAVIEPNRQTPPLT